MGKVIIAIHGLGNKPAAGLLEKWWWKSISEGLRNHTKNKYRKPLFKLVYWADVLYDHPKDANCTDPEDPSFISEPYEPETFPVEIKEHSLRMKIMDSISEEINKIFLNDDYSLNFSALNDLILEKYFRDLDAYYYDEINGKHQPVRETLRDRLKSVLTEYKNDDILLIAHSMGSIIALDVLSLFKDEVQIDTLITIGSPLGLPVVVSKIVNELKLKNSETKKLEAPKSIKNYWYNFSDLEDRVAFNYKLNDDFSESSNGLKVTDFVVNNNYSSDGRHNPHKSYGYLRTPEVAEKIYQFLTKDPEPLFDRIWYNVLRIFAKIENTVRKNKI
jgi:pimeloyl-ACP methyl ester carboxylesterase